MQDLKPRSEPPKDNDDPKHYVSLYGKWKIQRFTPDASGQLVLAEEREGLNVITTAGKEALASLLNAAAQTATTNTFKYIGVGTGSGAESAADTALGTQVARHTGTVSYVSNAIYQIVATFPTGAAAGAIVEYGLFNSSSAGTMLCRDIESVINVGASDVLVPTIQITLS